MIMQFTTQPPFRGEPVVAPFTVVKDTQERDAGYHFRMTEKVKGKLCPLVVPVVVRKMETGDYSIDGYEDRVTVERKALSDLFQSMTRERERFEREYMRMAAIVADGGQACVVVEGTYEQTLTDPPTAANPLAIESTWLSWWNKYRVPLVWAGPKTMAERFTYRFLHWWWEVNVG
jgi:DNA excision repair protein ERCC-4